MLMLPKTNTVNIVFTVCKSLRIEVSVMMSRNREREVSDARLIIYYLMSKSNLNQKIIAGLMQRSESGVSKGLKSLKILLDTDKAFKTKLKEVLKEFPEITIDTIKS